jgi:transcriptional regulator with XRE-family HTH domain
MPRQRLEIGRRGFGPQIGDVVHEARQLVGWSQEELATRAKTSQATIWRIETDSGTHLDLLVLERVLSALGIRATLDLDARHLADRRHQLDGVHARVNGFAGRWLARLGWLTATEAPIGDGAPRGWIDLLGFRPADGSLLVGETKTEILDLGALQRTVAFYTREAPTVARTLGWIPRCVAVIVVALDTHAVAHRIADSRDAFKLAFPARVEATAAWLRDPVSPAPNGWTLAVADPASRARAWLHPSAITSRRLPTYLDYRDAAIRLGRPRG